MSVIRQSQRRVTSATTGSRYRPRKDIAVDSTPLRSFSDLLRSSPAALAITGCGTASTRRAVLLMAESLVPFGRLGYKRQTATPAGVFSDAAYTTDESCAPPSWRRFFSPDSR